ncbi:MAG: hypothetical protein HKM24_01580 [Gammaproteobacteria bacterium]|nr:hypothetical protein [Gammaproteobacteria bacterium]
MMTGSQDNQLVAVTDLREYFRDSVLAACDKFRVDASSDAQHYVVNLLACYSRADQFELGNGRRNTFKPLALMLADALQADSIQQRRQTLKQIGDIALFIAGFFARGLSSRPTNLDYYIGMGGSAYDYVAELSHQTVMLGKSAIIFRELSEKFPSLVDVINDIYEDSSTVDDQEAVRVYEQWLTTGSPRAERLLKELGIHPLKKHSH